MIQAINQAILLLCVTPQVLFSLVVRHTMISITVSSKLLSMDWNDSNSPQQRSLIRKWFQWVLMIHQWCLAACSSNPTEQKRWTSRDKYHMIQSLCRESQLDRGHEKLIKFHRQSYARLVRLEFIMNSVKTPFQYSLLL